MSEKETVALTAPAPAPKVPIPDPGYTKTIEVLVPEDKPYDLPLIKYLGEAYQNGNVSLKGLTLTFRTTDSKQEAIVAFKTAGVQTQESLAGKRESFWFMSNSSNYGEKKLVSVVPKNDLSTQIHPIPSDLSTAYLYAYCSKKSKLTLFFDIVISGAENEVVTLN
jgi:hypothetical protein